MLRRHKPLSVYLREFTNAFIILFVFLTFTINMKISHFSWLNCLEKSGDGVLPIVHFLHASSLSLRCAFPLIAIGPLPLHKGPKNPPSNFQPKVSHPVIMHRNLLRQPQNSPVSALIILFLAWKLLLFAVAFLTPGAGYDSSTNLLFQSQGLSGTPQLNLNKESWDFARLAGKLTRWDAVYFVSIGQRGRVFEQEWAFGWGWTQLLAEVNHSRQSA